jgi:hypothetical protein
VFSSEASTVPFYRIKMGRFEKAEMAAVDYFSFPTDDGDWH